jgi:hypothetical protein
MLSIFLGFGIRSEPILYSFEDLRKKGWRAPASDLLVISSGTQLRAFRWRNLRVWFLNSWNVMGVGVGQSPEVEELIEDSTWLDLGCSIFWHARNLPGKSSSNSFLVMGIAFTLRLFLRDVCIFIIKHIRFWRMPEHCTSLSKTISLRFLKTNKSDVPLSYNF